MDHLSHPFSRPGQTTQHEPHIHRCSRSAALRLQGGLSRRVLRRLLSHCTPSNLRGHLRPPFAQRKPRKHTVATSRKWMAKPKLGADACLAPQNAGSLHRTTWTKPNPSFASLPSQGSALLCRSRQCRLRLVNQEFFEPFNSKRVTLPTSDGSRDSHEFLHNHGTPALNHREIPSKVNRPPAPRTSHKRRMNSPCGKQILYPRIKPVIVEDTTCGVSLLTGTISGSNFAIP